MPTLGFTHFQPAQPTTVGKRATLWAQDFAIALEQVEFVLQSLRLRGLRGATGTQASYLGLLDGDPAKVDALEAKFADKLGWTVMQDGNRGWRRSIGLVHAWRPGWGRSS